MELFASPRSRLLPSSTVAFAIYLEMARLDPFDIGQIIAHAHHGLNAPKIAELVVKTDGLSPSKQAVHDVLTKHEDDPSRRGERAEFGSELVTRKPQRSR